MDYIRSSSKLLTVPDLDGGVNYSLEPHKIADNQLSDVCNMEFEDGVLKKRGGYVTLADLPEQGEVLAMREFNGTLYCATRNAFIAVDPMDGQARILNTGVANTQPGTFIEKDNMLYYFSGAEIFKVSPYLSYPDLQDQSVVGSKPTLELKQDVFTDGENIYDFTKSPAESYSLNQTMNAKRLCRYGDTVYGVQKAGLEKETTLTSFRLTEGEDGKYTASDLSATTFTMNFSNVTSSSFALYDNSIRSVIAVKGYLLFNLNNVFSVVGSSAAYQAYRPMTVKYNLQTGETETLCRVDGSVGKSGLIAGYGDTVVELIKGIDQSDDRLQVFVRNYETGEETSFFSSLDLELAVVNPSTAPTPAPPTLTMVDRDLLLLTARFAQGSQSVWKTCLLRLKPNSLAIVEESADLIADLFKIGSNYYEIPVDLLENGDCFPESNMRTVSIYNFSKGTIAKGMDKTFDAPITWYYGTRFCGKGGAVKLLVTSELVPVRVDGYIPLAMTARYDTSPSTPVYTVTVTGEAINALSRKVRLQVIEGPNPGSTVRTMTIPIPYNQLEPTAVSDIAGNLRLTENSENHNAVIQRGEKFVEGETITLTYKEQLTGNPIRQCHLAATYGGTSFTAESGTRLFVAGNPNEPDTYYYSDVNNFEYFPELQFEMIDDNSQPITGFAKHYQDLIVFKERSIFSLNYQSTETGALFQRRRIHDSVGCDMPGSIQIINNDVVFGNCEKGIFLLSIKDLSGERNLNPISLNISGARGIGQFGRAEKQLARSLDFKNKYYLALGGRMYVWNYELSPFGGRQDRLSWFVYDGLPASAMAAVGEYPVFARSGSFRINELNGAANDGGQPILASFTTKAFDFGDANAWKAIHHLWMNLTSASEIDLKLQTATEREQSPWQTVRFHPNRRFGNLLSRRVKCKRALYFSFGLQDSMQDIPFDVTNIKIEYDVYKSRR